MLKTNTNHILKVMKVISWILFIALCIKPGALLISGSITFFMNPGGAKNVYLGMDLSALYASSIRNFEYVLSFLIALATMKAYLFYLVINIFSKINMDHPFSSSMIDLLKKMSYVAFGIGVVALIAQDFTKRLFKNGLQVLRDWGGAKFLFLAGILLIIALVFKRGVEMQAENELTI